MEVRFNLEKYDILGVACLLGIKRSSIEKLEEYIDNNKTIDLNLLKEGDKGFIEFKQLISVMSATQIFKELGL